MTLVVLDMSAALDTVDHDILITRLEKRIGETGSAIAWIRSKIRCWYPPRLGTGASAIHYVHRPNRQHHQTTPLELPPLIMQTAHIEFNITDDNGRQCDCDVIPSPSVYNFGIAFDAEMAMVCHVQHIYRTPCYHLRNIASIRTCLTEKTAVKIIHSMVIGRLDHANGLLFGIPECLVTKLQRVQHSAARLVVRCNIREHNNPVLMKLHWLHMKQRI